MQRNPVFHLDGQTDEARVISTSSLICPATSPAAIWKAGWGAFTWKLSVTDLAQHSETSSLSFPVAQHSLVIEAMPEGGQFRPGVENILYVLTSYPDGTPAPSRLSMQFYS